MTTGSLFSPEQHGQFSRLCDQGFYRDALAFLYNHGNRTSLEYLWYEGYLQATLGWDQEALVSLERYRRAEPDHDLLGVTSGFMADIYHSDGMLYEASDEIRLAMEYLPDDPDILRKAQEIYDDINDQFKGIILAILIVRLLSTSISQQYKYLQGLFRNCIDLSHHGDSVLIQEQP